MDPVGFSKISVLNVLCGVIQIGVELCRIGSKWQKRV